MDFLTTELVEDSDFEDVSLCDHPDVADNAELIKPGGGYVTPRSFAPSPDEQRARAKAAALKKILLKYGVPQVEIELRPGRPSSHGVWDAGFIVAEMSHHTVSRYSHSNLTPLRNLCREGRSDLAGPLCNGYGGWDLCYRIFTFGYANHPGAGGPYTVPALTAGKFTIPKDSARRYVWGTEWEGGLDERDWDRVLKNPQTGISMTFREFMGRANAALEEFLEIHPDAHLEHSTWTSRKIDRLHYTRLDGIAEKNKYKKKVLAQIAKPKVFLPNVREQFLNFKNHQKVTRLKGVKIIQKELNKRYGAGLKVTGLVDTPTVNAWARHERTVGVVGRPRVPDAATLSALGGKSFRVVLK